MAESKEGHSTTSMGSGSEPFFDHICQPCSEEKVLEAVGFCIDCEEWLCEECYKHHRRPRPSRNHELMDMEQMKSKLPSARGRDRCTQTCDQHDGKRIKYFCSSHDNVGCSMCMVQNHKGCSLESIMDITQDIFNKAEFTTLMDRFKDVVDITKDIQDKVKQCNTHTSTNSVETMKAIMEFRNEINETLDEIEKNLEIQCSTKKETELKKLEQLNEQCNTVQSESDTITREMEELKGRDKNCDAFVAMKRAGIKIASLEDTTMVIRSSIRVSTFAFKQNRDIIQALKTQCGIGTLKVDVERDELYYANVKAEHVKDISVRCAGNATCGITCSALLSSNELVLVDYENKQVKVMDTIQNRMISDMKLDGTPACLTIMHDKTFAVSVHDKHKIAIIKWDNSGKLSYEKNIKVNGQCVGLAFYEGKFFVTFHSPDKLELLDVSGSVLRSLVTNSPTKEMLDSPQDVTLSHDKRSLFVSSFRNNMLIRLRLDGTEEAKYCDQEMRGPEQAAVDENGMVYVSAYFSNNVHLITPDCKKVKVLLVEADGLTHVTSISYCDQRKRLYIGMNGCTYIKVFQLK